MKPVVYVDILFLLNFVLNYLLLLTTQKICKNPAKAWQLSIGAAAGSIYAVLMFFPSLSIFYSIIAKLVFSALLVIISFRITKWREFMRLFIVFYLANFMFAGAAFALFYFTDIGSYIGAITSNGVFYFDIPIGTLLISSAIAYGGIHIGYRIYKKQLQKTGRLFDISITLGEKNVQMLALLDTGNSLADPISGTPVIVAEYDTLKTLLPQHVCDVFDKHETDYYTIISSLMSDTSEMRFHLIPFCSLGKDDGMILAFKPDSISIQKGQNHPGNVLVGIYNKHISKGQEYKALLHPQVTCEIDNIIMKVGT